MIVRRLGIDEWMTGREVRLQALAGSPPGTFASTVELSSQWDDEQWRHWMGTRVLFVAEDEGALVGSLGVKIHDDLPCLVSMWVVPAARGRGTSALLLTTVQDWVREQEHRELRLWVVEGNAPAEALYLRHGFTHTGGKHPCAVDDARVEYEMFKPL